MGMWISNELAKFLELLLIFLFLRFVLNYFVSQLQKRNREFPHSVGNFVKTVTEKFANFVNHSPNKTTNFTNVSWNKTMIHQLVTTASSFSDEFHQSAIRKYCEFAENNPFNFINSSQEKIANFQKVSNFMKEGITGKKSWNLQSIFSIGIFKKNP